MSVKKAYLRKKIEGVVYDIYARTSADLVAYDSSEVPAGSIAKAVSDLATALETVTTQTTGTIDTRVAAACSDLYDRIMGMTDQDTINEAYDTLKEIADWIDNYEGEGGSAALVTSAISELRTAIGTASVEADPENEVEAQAATGLIARIEALEGSATNVTASQTNGNIVVDGSEVTVYTHPVSHAATMITEDSTHKFVTAAQISIINDAAAVRIVEEVPNSASENDLFIVVDAEEEQQSGGE